MSQAGQILPLESIQPGMKLAEAIRDRLGNVMLTEATQLTEQHLATLRQRGIASALIVPERQPPSNEELATLRLSVEARLRRIFRKTLEYPANRKLFETILEYRQETLR